MERIQTAIIVCSFLGIYGETGALECNNISVAQFALEVIGTLLATTVALFILNFARRKNKSKSK